MVYFRFEFGLGDGKKKVKSTWKSTMSGWEFVNQEVEKARELAKYKTADNYLTAARSYTRFLDSDDWLFSEMTVETLGNYQRWLREHNICPNTISAYMRSLRVMYHRACESDGEEPDDKVFAKVYTGRAKTAKRSITQDNIRQLLSLSLPPNSSLAFARDIFIFSFYAMGMPFVDIAYLKKEQVKGDSILYARHKTGQRVKVALLPAMVDIMRRYHQEDSEYVFPILREKAFADISHAKAESPRDTLHRLYLLRLRQYNYSLSRLSEKLGATFHLSSYVVRHSWASLAYQHHVDIGLIGKALGHTKSSTTLLYIKGIEETDLGNVNQSLMEDLGL